ncbi:hypothetical protein [Lactococcus allomyrinae]|uniref:Uncharacterized protein n=1 Tax=Lactococcus allomyrinae TaxID=2419773 RepID=A0A387B7U1_9LACT|nr:hypothetical protein [Lactococcus allomyrinae]AYF99864.1 hypothetical protein D7I46_01450 [Lactococcus allomyrinae]
MRKRLTISLEEEVMKSFSSILNKEGMTIQTFLELIANKTVNTGESPLTLGWNSAIFTPNTENKLQNQEMKPSEKAENQTKTKKKSAISTSTMTEKHEEEVVDIENNITNPFAGLAK